MYALQTPQTFYEDGLNWKLFATIRKYKIIDLVNGSYNPSSMHKLHLWRLSTAYNLPNMQVGSKAIGEDVTCVPPRKGAHDPNLKLHWRFQIQYKYEKLSRPNGVFPMIAHVLATL